VFGRRSDEDFADEVQAHLDLETDRLVGEGLNEADARAAARRAFGNVLGARERYYESARWTWLSALRQDLRYAVRGLGTHRAFTATVVLTLGLGLGLVTAFFTVFNAYVLRPFAVRDPASLYDVGWQRPETAGRRFTWRELAEVAARRDLVDAAIAQQTTTLWSEGRPVDAVFVSPDYFDVLGVGVRLGRALSPADARIDGGAAPVVLSDVAWHALFGGDRSVIGRTIDLDRHPAVVVGVLGPAFAGLDETPRDMWMPLSWSSVVAGQDLTGPRAARALEIVVRIRRDVPVERVSAALAPTLDRAAAAASGSSEPVRPDLRSRATPHPLSAELLLMLAPVAAAFLLVLAAACANVSTIMLARANARHREIALRLALGASRSRIVRQLVTEGLVLAMMAGVLGLILADAAIRAGTAAFAAMLPASAAGALRTAPFTFDPRVFAATFALAALAAILFALVPALRATRVVLVPALRGEGVGGQGSTSRLRDGLVAAQVAVSLLLVISAATLMANGWAIGGTDLGFDARHLVLVSRGTGGGAPLAAAADTMARDARVGVVAAASIPPISERRSLAVVAPTASAASFVVPYTFVSPEYFAALGVPMVGGRPFRTEEAEHAAPVAIVSAAMAAALWPHVNPIGQPLWIRPPDGPGVDRLPLAESVTVVGIAGDVVSGLMYDREDHARLYLPMARDDGRASTILVRGRAGSSLTPDAVRAVLDRAADVASNPLAFDVATMDDVVRGEMVPIRAASWVGTLLGLVALALSVAGLYGVMTYTLGQRTREIGIRLALGASRARIARLVAVHSARVFSAGLVIGLAGAVISLHALAAVVDLENVSVVDLPAMAAGILVVAVAAALAAIWPVRRAVRIDPAATLKKD
jgi:predicted permease